MLAGWAPASNRAKSLFSAASAGRFPVALGTTSGASKATRHGPSTYGARVSQDLLVGAHARHVHQPPVLVEHGDAGGLTLAPGEVDTDVEHGASLPYRARCVLNVGYA